MDNFKARDSDSVAHTSAGDHDHLQVHQGDGELYSLPDVDMALIYELMQWPYYGDDSQLPNLDEMMQDLEPDIDPLSILITEPMEVDEAEENVTAPKAIVDIEAIEPAAAAQIVATTKTESAESPAAAPIVLPKSNRRVKASPSFLCGTCQLSFESSWIRNIHQRGHYLNPTQTYVCPAERCQRVYFKKPSLLYHQRIMGHHDWQFRCPRCNKAFEVRHMLKRHILYRTCVKKFKLYTK